MLTTSPTAALGVFDHPDQAKSAIEALKIAGFRDEQIGVASRLWSKRLQNLDADDQQVAERGAVAGSVIGGSVGAIFGLVGGMLVPGAIPIVAGQLLVSTLLGGAAGAAAGVFGGPFVALGLSEHEVKKHAQFIDQDKTVLIVYSPDRRDDAENIMIEQGAYDESMSSSP